MTLPARQLSDNNPGGTGLGQSASDLISLHGVTPVAQAAIIATLLAAGTLVSVVTRVNQIIVALKNKGIISQT